MQPEKDKDWEEQENSRARIPAVHSISMIENIFISILDEKRSKAMKKLQKVSKDKKETVEAYIQCVCGVCDCVTYGHTSSDAEFINAGCLSKALK